MDNDKSPKTAKNNCELCHYITDNITDYNKHLSTAKHTRMITENDKSPKNTKYNCELCQYITDNIKDYRRHLTTAKHHRITMNNDKSPKNTKIIHNSKVISHHICNCGKKYLYLSGLSKHKHTCSENISNEISWTIDPSSNEIKLNETMMYKLFKEMMESTHGIITTMTESNKEVISTMTESNNELKQIIMNQQTQILELASKPIINNTMNNSNNNNNNNITVNMFLNDYCKEAMTLTHFIKSIKPSKEQIMYMTNKGNREGLMQIMNHSLCSMKITERPIHFTDIKRNTNWIKNDDGWTKEQEQESMMRLCKNINKSCQQTILGLINDDKEYLVPRSDKHELFLKMVMEANGGAGFKEESNATYAINIIKEQLYLGKDEIQKAIC